MTTSIDNGSIYYIIKRNDGVTEEPTFDDRIAGRYGQMSPAEQRVARFFSGKSRGSIDRISGGTGRKGGDQ
jgi:hypothetical protein